MMPLPPFQAVPSAAGAGFALSLKPGLQAFQGHFPGDPVLPGVVQVDWAIQLGQTAFGPLAGFQAIEQLKFLRPLHPGDPLTLNLSLAAGCLRFEYLSGGQRSSSGSIRFGRTP